MAKESGLVYSLVKAGYISSDKGNEILKNATLEEKPLITYVVDNGIVSSDVIKNFFEREYGYPYLNLDDFDVTEIPEKYLNQKVILKHHALPVYTQGKTLYLAMSDTTNVTALDDFSVFFGMHTDIILVDETKLNNVLKKLFMDAMSNLDVGLADIDIAAVDDNMATEEEQQPSDEPDEDSAPVVKFIDNILLSSIN